MSGFKVIEQKNISDSLVSSIETMMLLSGSES